MADWILRIYIHVRRHRLLGTLILLVVTALLVSSALRLDFKEDISAFLPKEDKYEKSMEVFMRTAGAEKLFVVFSQRDSTESDPSGMVRAIDDFTIAVEEADTASLAGTIISSVDTDKAEEMIDYVYANIPYFLTGADYARIDSLLSDEGLVARQLHADKEMLLSPMGGLSSRNISVDPLGLFHPVLGKLKGASAELRYERYEGHIFSPDMRKAIVTIESPYGSSETDCNTRLMNMLRQCADSVMASNASVDVHITGGPAIAVGNAERIKLDSLRSVAVAATLILLLLCYTFRNARNLLLILVSVGWGWLFAIGFFAVSHGSVSLIVLGLSSVILGIAVNYPLHLISHLSESTSHKSALRQVAAPLLVGNITTVGAFIVLVPLKAEALHDLGLFSALLLVGTILFVLLALPHMVGKNRHCSHEMLDRVADVSLDRKKWLVWLVVALTPILAYFSLKTGFDTDMHNINYMDEAQKSDMAYLQANMKTEGEIPKVYVVSSDSTLDGALEKARISRNGIRHMQRDGLIDSSVGCGQFIVSQKEQQRRLERWRAFIAENGDRLKAEMAASAKAEGFSDGAFDGFYSILDGEYDVQGQEHFGPMASLFSNYLCANGDSTEYSVIEILSVRKENMQEVESQFDTRGIFNFDVDSMNSTAARLLSDNFNYIGWTCSVIVFLFLWLSLGSLELAIVSFLPMAVSWLWILGLMALLGIKFNIVSIILASFIFGQGDDYTIFMTEGSSYEYAFRRKILRSYKGSIAVSALIMFVGIGALVFAQHPALRSLGQVTIVGMFSVVVMALIIPPLLFRWLVSKDGEYRLRPLSFDMLLRRLRKPLEHGSLEWCCELVLDRFRYKGGSVTRTVSANLMRADDIALWMANVKEDEPVYIIEHGYGELSLVYALMRKKACVTAVVADADRAEMLRYSAEGVAGNIKTMTMRDWKDVDEAGHDVYRLVCDELRATIVIKKD